MGKIYSYLLKEFVSSLTRYFLILFLLVSIVYFVRIAGYTEYMVLTFVDIFQIYFYFVPQIILYTFPITFFIALTYTLFNFSKDGEMLVIFSLGKSPKSLINLFLLVGVFTSLLLMINSLILIPLSEQSSDNFLSIKKTESKINVKGNEVGQRVGKWNIFTKKVDDLEYKDLVMFSKDSKKEQLILAKGAKFGSSNNKVILFLENGAHYLINKNEIVQTNFKELKLQNNLKRDTLSNKGIVEYWSEIDKNHYRAKWLSSYMLLSLFPLLSIFLAFSIGVINARVQNRIVSFWIGLTVFSYYGFLFKVADKSPLYGSFGFIVLFSMISYLILNKTILKRY